MRRFSFRLALMVSAFILLAALQNGGGIPLPIQRQRSAPVREVSQCSAAVWTSPTPLFAETSSVRSLRDARVIPHAGGWLVVGSPVTSDGTLLWQETIVAASNGRVVGPPGEGRDFLVPRLIGDDSGGAHLVWGETADSSTPLTLEDRLVTAVTSVWHATLDNDSDSWTPAREAAGAGGSRLVWTGGGRSIGSTEEPSRLGLLAPLGDRTPESFNRSTLLGLTTTSDGIAVTERIQLPATVVAADLVRLNGRTTIVFASNHETRSANVAIWAQWRHADGREWSDPELVDRLPPGASLSTLAAFKVGDNLVAVWKFDGVRDSATLRVRSLALGATEWSEAADLILPAASGGESFLADTCGRIHVLLEALERDGTLSVLHAVHEAGWNVPSVVFGDALPQNPTLAVDHRRRISAVMLGYPHGVARGAQPINLISHLESK